MASLINTKYGKLSSFEIYNIFAIKRDIDWIHELLHDDFMYVQDYTMKTREALEHETITEGKKYFMTQVQLWRGDKIYREVSNEREIV